MAIASVGIRVSKEVFEKIHDIAHTEQLTLIESADLLIANYESDIRKLRDEKANLEAQLKEAKTKLESEIKELQAKLENENAQLKTIKTKLESENAQLRGTKTQLENENNKLESENERLKKLLDLRTQRLGVYLDFMNKMNRINYEDRIRKTVWYEEWRKMQAQEKPLFEEEKSVK